MTAPAARSIYWLVADYWQAYAEFVDVMRSAESLPKGSPEQAKAEAATGLAGEKADDAGCTVVAFVPTWTAEARIRANFVAGLVDRNGSLTIEELEALISSLPTLVETKRVTS